MDNAPATEQERDARIFRLTQELINTEREKKASAAAYRDEVKRLKAEIAELATTPIGAPQPAAE